MLNAKRTKYFSCAIIIIILKGTVCYDLVAGGLVLEVALSQRFF